MDTEEANRLENCIIYAIFTIFFLFVFIFVLYLIHMKTFNDYPATGDEIKALNLNNRKSSREDDGEVF